MSSSWTTASKAKGKCESGVDDHGCCGQADIKLFTLSKSLIYCRNLRQNTLPRPVNLFMSPIQFALFDRARVPYHKQNSFCYGDNSSNEQREQHFLEDIYKLQTLNTKYRRSPTHRASQSPQPPTNSPCQTRQYLVANSPQQPPLSCHSTLVCCRPLVFQLVQICVQGTWYFQRAAQSCYSPRPWQPFVPLLFSTISIFPGAQSMAQ